jgi:AraC-like DNA-binding protein
MTRRAPQSRLVLQTSVRSPLGQVSLAGVIRNGRGLPFQRLRTFGRYALVFLLEGGGRMKAGSLPLLKLRVGDLLFVYPEIPHTYGPGPGETWSEFYVVFDGPAFDLWRRAGLLQPGHPVQHLGNARRWLPRLEAIVDPRLPDTPEGMLRRVCRLQEFLADIARRPAPQPQRLPWLDHAARQLLAAPPVPVPAVARALGLSYETFRKEFARETGLPPARFRLHRLIEQARLLITERHLTNKQVAETLGFYDEFHFSRHFRRVTGQSPRTFRAQIR